MPFLLAFASTRISWFVLTPLFSLSKKFNDEAEHYFKIGTFTEAPPPDDVPPEEITPSPTPTDGPLHLVEISILLDSAAAETGFRLSWGDEVIFERSPGHFEGKDSTTVIESIYLPAGSFTLTLLDTAGDGKFHRSAQ